MDKFTIASVQMRLRMAATLDECREDLRRSMRAAEAKRARLVLFPELAGLMVAPPLMRDRGTNLLRRSAAGQRRTSTLWQRWSGAMAGWLAGALKSDPRRSLAGLLEVDATRLWESYVELFGGLARTHGVTVVAPSAYLPDPATGVILNTVGVFGPGGDLLGRQSRVMAAPSDEGLAQRGRTWDVVETEVGRLGIMLGADVLYPEVGRLYAYQNAEVLLLQAACSSLATYNKLRSGILARMQDNQLYAAASFLVGPYPFQAAGSAPMIGKSAIFAPQELTPRFNGVLVEMGSTQSEGIVTAEWDYGALRRLWEQSETLQRRPFVPEQATVLLAALYTQLSALPQPQSVELLAATVDDSADALAVEAAVGDATSGGVDAAATRAAVAAPLPGEGDEALLELSDLPVLGAVTSRWPLGDASTEADAAEMVETVVDWPKAGAWDDAATQAEIRRDDETDEMDAVHTAADETGQPSAASSTSEVAAAGDEPAPAEPIGGVEPAGERDA